MEDLRHHRELQLGAAFKVVNGGSCASLHVTMKKGQVIKAETDSVVSMSEHVSLGSTVDGGIISGLARSMLSGETFFMQQLRAERDDSDILLAASVPGDVLVMEVNSDDGICCRSGAFLAADDGVQVSTETQSSLSNAIFSGAGVFVLRCSGFGAVALHSEQGAIVKYTLKKGEARRVDNGHVLAWQGGMRFTTGLATSRGGLLQRLFSSSTSGEGLMCHFHGPGYVFVQTHKGCSASGSGHGGASAQGGCGNVRVGSDCGGGNGIVACCFLVVFFVCFVSFAGMFVWAAVNGGVQWDDGPNHHHHGHQQYSYQVGSSSYGQRSRRSSSHGNGGISY